MMVASPVACPCGGMLLARRFRWDTTYGSQTHDYGCDRCGATVSVASPIGTDPATILAPGQPTIEPEPRAAPEPSPVITGSVIGYRAWRIVGWQLYGTGVNRAWTPGVQTATCDSGDSDLFSWSMRLINAHSAPAPGCHCGITALARFTEKDEHWRNVDVFGAIEAWGENEGDPESEHSGFHLHHNGFRAKYGKVVLLAVEDDWPAAKKAAVRALAREHDADICKRSHLEMAAKEHGQLVPDELLMWVAKNEPLSAWDPYSYIQRGNMFPPSYSYPTYTPTLRSWSIAPRKKNKAAKPGISQTLGYPGPPSNPTVKARKGRRVKDSKGAVWTCVKGGKPGLWQREEQVTEITDAQAPQPRTTSDSRVHLIRLGVPSSGDTIHRSDCHYIKRAKGEPLRWNWADEQGYANLDWEGELRRNGLRPCQWCHPEGLR